MASAQVKDDTSGFCFTCNNYRPLMPGSPPLCEECDKEAMPMAEPTPAPIPTKLVAYTGFCQHDSKITRQDGSETRCARCLIKL